MLMTKLRNSFKKLENSLKFFEEKLPNPIVCIRWNRCWLEINWISSSSDFYMCPTNLFHSTQEIENESVTEKLRVFYQSKECCTFSIARHRLCVVCGVTQFQFNSKLMTCVCLSVLKCLKSVIFSRIHLILDSYEWFSVSPNVHE